MGQAHLHQLGTEKIQAPNHYNHRQQTETEIMAGDVAEHPLFPFPSVAVGCNDLGLYLLCPKLMKVNLTHIDISYLKEEKSLVK